MHLQDLEKKALRHLTTIKETKVPNLPFLTPQKSLIKQKRKSSLSRKSSIPPHDQSDQCLYFLPPQKTPCTELKCTKHAGWRVIFLAKLELENYELVRKYRRLNELQKRIVKDVERRRNHVDYLISVLPNEEGVDAFDVDDRLMVADVDVAGVVDQSMVVDDHSMVVDVAGVDDQSMVVDDQPMMVKDLESNIIINSITPTLFRQEVDSNILLKVVNVSNASSSLVTEDKQKNNDSFITPLPDIDISIDPVISNPNQGLIIHPTIDISIELVESSNSKSIEVFGVDLEHRETGNLVINPKQHALEEDIEKDSPLLMTKESSKESRIVDIEK